MSMMCNRPGENDLERSVIYQYYYVKKRIGKGAYGVVWKAYKKANNQAVAIKKVYDAFNSKEDAQRTYREVIYLKAFRGHPNIVQLLHLHRSSNNKDLYLVFEYMEIDLHMYLSEGNKLREGQVRYIMYQLLKALKYIHSGNVVHRDLKPSNILLNSDCSCKLGDFGLARSLNDSSRPDPGGRLTEYVATRWYRAPEILVGAKNYSKGVDMWSLGCVLGEMLTGCPLFPGESSVHQLELIGRAVEWSREELEAALGPGVRLRLPEATRFALKARLAGCSAEATDLALRLLQVEPQRRPTAAEALRHPLVSRYRAQPEPVLRRAVCPKYPDHRQLSVQDYRSALYNYDRQASHQRRLVRPQTKAATDPELTASTNSYYHYPVSAHQSHVIEQVAYFRGNSISKFR